jgi:hypothetical protein
MLEYTDHLIAGVLIICLVFVENIHVFRHKVVGKIIYVILFMNAFYVKENAGLAILSGLLGTMVLIVNANHSNQRHHERSFDV